GEWIGNYIGFNQMACQEIMVEFLKDVPISPLRIAILYTLKQLSKRVRYVKIVAYMICVSGQFPNAEVDDAEVYSVINIIFAFRNEYISRMHITMLFSYSLQLALR